MVGWNVLMRAAGLTAAFTAAALAFTAGISLGGTSKERDEPFYLKEDGVYRFDPNGGEGEKLVDLPALGTHSFPARPLYLTMESGDGSYLVYLKEEQGGGKTLYYRGSGGSGAEQTAASGVRIYRFVDDHRLIYEAEDGEGALSYHLFDLDTGADRPVDMGELRHGLISLHTDPSKGRLLWEANRIPPSPTTADTDTGSDLFTADVSGGGFQRTQLDSHVGDLHFSDDQESAYYLNGSTLYCVKGLKERRKVAEHVQKFWAMEETGGVYYLTDETESDMKELIVDDLEEEDARAVPPDKSHYQSEVPEEEGTGTMDEERFYADLDRYVEKEKRDAKRQELDKWMYDDLGLVTTGDLYYSDGRTSRKLADHVSAAEDRGVVGEGLFIQRFDGSSRTPVNLSKIREEDIRTYLQDREAWEKENAYTVVMASKDRLIDLPFGWEDFQNMGGRFIYDSAEESGFYMEAFWLDAARERLYYIDDWQADGSGTLKLASYSGGSLSAGRRIDDGVSYIGGTIGDGIYYIKQKSDGSKSLWVDGTLVSDHVDSLGGEPMDGGLYYIVNYQEETGTADLYRWKNGQNQQISDRIVQFEPLPDGAVAVIRDYDFQKGSGTLCLWREGGDLMKLDSGVMEMKLSPIAEDYR